MTTTVLSLKDIVKSIFEINENTENIVPLGSCQMGIVSWPTKLCFLHAHHFYCCGHQKPSRIGWLVKYTSFKSSQILLSDWLKTGESGAMTWSKAIYPPLHDLLFVHQLSSGQIKSLLGELELKKVVGQDPQAVKCSHIGGAKLDNLKVLFALKRLLQTNINIWQGCQPSP